MINCLCEEHKDELKRSSLDELKIRLQSEKDELATRQEEIKSLNGSKEAIKSHLSEYQKFELDRILDTYENILSTQAMIIKIIEHEINERSGLDENHEL